MSIEHVAGWTLLQAVHSAFPLACVKCYESLLLCRGKNYKQRINRVFKKGNPSQLCFRNAQEAFAAVVDAGRRTRPLAGANAINFSGSYSNTAFDDIEIDCLIKIPAQPGGVWYCDPTAPSGLCHIVESGTQPLLPRPVAEEVAMLASVFVPAVGADDESKSTNTMLHYPPGSTQYIIGEAYGPLNEATTSTMMPVQKLLQLERILCFIQAKEKTDNICDCVLGVVLIGPCMDISTCKAVFAALQYYRAPLQRLWSLSAAQRLFAIRLQPLVTHVQQSLLRLEARLEARLETIIHSETAIQVSIERLTAQVLRLFPHAGNGAEFGAHSAEIADGGAAARPPATAALSN